MTKHISLVFLLLVAAVGLASAESPWRFSTSLSVKETFDNNVFLQDSTALAHKSSWVSSFTPLLSLSYQATPEFTLAVSYAPEVVFYHSYSSEDHVDHRATLNFRGTSGDTAWEVNHTIVGIQGNDWGPTFDLAHGGDIPAVGGIPLRDRRDAIIYRNNIRLTQTIGSCFLRPVFTAYVHDFKTQQSDVSGYENYIDRYDVNGGLDIGFAAARKTWLVFGYRYGYQHQGERLGVLSPYSSNYHRVLAGIEGAPSDWLKLQVMAGPDIRVFRSGNLPPTFDKNELLWYVDASATITFGKNDTLAVTLTRYEQPAFSSHSVYEDILYSIAWQHRCHDKLTATIGLKIYEGDWQSPVNRDDVIYTPNASVSYIFARHFSADLTWSYDAVKSEVPNTAGREFTRHLVSFGLKHSF